MFGNMTTLMSGIFICCPMQSAEQPEALFPTLFGILTIIHSSPVHNSHFSSNAGHRLAQVPCRGLSRILIIAHSGFVRDFTYLLPSARLCGNMATSMSGKSNCANVRDSHLPSNAERRPAQRSCPDFVRDSQSYLSVTITILSGIPIIIHFDFVRDFNFAYPLSSTPLSEIICTNVRDSHLPSNSERRPVRDSCPGFVRDYDYGHFQSCLGFSIIPFSHNHDSARDSDHNPIRLCPGF